MFIYIIAIQSQAQPSVTQFRSLPAETALFSNADAEALPPFLDWMGDLMAPMRHAERQVAHPKLQADDATWVESWARRVVAPRFLPPDFMDRWGGVVQTTPPPVPPDGYEKPLPPGKRYLLIQAFRLADGTPVRLIEDGINVTVSMSVADLRRLAKISFDAPDEDLLIAGSRLVFNAPKSRDAPPVLTLRPYGDARHTVRKGTVKSDLDANGIGKDWWSTITVSLTQDAALFSVSERSPSVPPKALDPGGNPATARTPVRF